MRHYLFILFFVFLLFRQSQSVTCNDVSGHSRPLATINFISCESRLSHVFLLLMVGTMLVLSCSGNFLVLFFFFFNSDLVSLGALFLSGDLSCWFFSPLPAFLDPSSSFCLCYQMPPLLEAHMQRQAETGVFFSPMVFM